MTGFSWKYNRRQWTKEYLRGRSSYLGKKSVRVQEARGVRDRLTLSALCRLLCVRVSVFASALPHFFIWFAFHTFSFYAFFSPRYSCVFPMSCLVSLFVEVAHLLLIFISFRLCSPPDNCFCYSYWHVTKMMIFSSALCMWLCAGVWLEPCMRPSRDGQ